MCHRTWAAVTAIAAVKKDAGCVIMSKVKGPYEGLSCKVTVRGLKRQIINPNGKKLSLHTSNKNKFTAKWR